MYNKPIGMLLIFHRSLTYECSSDINITIIKPLKEEDFL